MDHFSFNIELNSSPSRGELTVLFSGIGSPYPGHRIGPAVHDYYLVHTISSGEGTFEISGKRYTCREKETFFIFPGELFSYEASVSNPWTYHWAAFSGHSAAPILSNMGISPEQPIVRHQSIRRILPLYSHLRHAFRKGAATPALADLEAGGWLRVLMREYGSRIQESKLVQAKSSDIDRQVDQMILWLTLQYEQQISIDRIAKTLGYHRTHLSKMFKQALGISPMQYLFKVRMERAESLLAGSLTIAQIASSVGYPDALHFSKQFRKWKGMSPSVYRETIHSQDIPKR
ncbi:AraC family transcriptional regulator [Paenibacillaceae bacterium]|nr:AraC family transcriptional regulator [Paenibacillaceae bacterium]